MSNIIDKIQVSGVTYDIGGTGGGGNPTVELTQAEYEALVTAGTVSADTYYIITDAQAGDLTNYYTKTETDNAITAATSTKQDTLVSGTNIKTINNESILGSGNIDIQGGGGGKAIEAGTNISVTTGATADTINCTLPIKSGSASGALIFGDMYNSRATSTNSVAFGNATTAQTLYGFACGNHTKVTSQCAFAEGNYTVGNGYFSHAEGNYTSAMTSSSHAEGSYTKTSNDSEHASGQYNVSNKETTTFGNSGNTLFSVGNGTADNARHNAFEIRQNGDIYLSSGGTDIKLQDHLGGGVNVVQTTGTSTTDVMSQDAVTTQLNGKGDAIGLDMVSAPQKKVTFQMKRGGNYGTTINSRDLTLGRGLVYGEEGSDTLSTSGLVETTAITTSISSSSTDSEIPSAKAVYDIVGNIETLLSQI